jgi:hypothetical protein
LLKAGVMTVISRINQWYTLNKNGKITWKMSPAIFRVI